MAKIHGVGIIEPSVLFFAFGMMIAITAVILQTGLTVFLKAFLITVIPVGILYATLSRFTSNAKTFGGIIVFLVFGGFLAGIGFMAMPQYLPLEVVPMALFGLPSPGISGTSYAIPSAILMILVGGLLGLIFAVSRTDERKAVIPTILASSIALFAVTNVLAGVFFSTWGDWMILLTPFAGFPILGSVISAGYVILAWLIWKRVSLALWIYLGIQVVAIVEVIWLGLWVSLLFNIPIIIYLVMARHQFKHNVPPVTLPAV